MKVNMNVLQISPFMKVVQKSGDLNISALKVKEASRKKALEVEDEESFIEGYSSSKSQTCEEDYEPYEKFRFSFEKEYDRLMEEESLNKGYEEDMTESKDEGELYEEIETENEEGESFYDEQLVSELTNEEEEDKISLKSLDEEEVVIRPEIKIYRLLKYVLKQPVFNSLMYDTALVLKNFTNSAGMSLYIKDCLKNEIMQMPREDKTWTYSNAQKIGPGGTIAAYVAYTRRYELVDDVNCHMEYPLGLNIRGSTYKSVFCFPLMTPELNELIGVIELYKHYEQPPYTKTEVEGVLNFVMWMMATFEEDYRSEVSHCRKAIHDFIQELLLSFIIEELPTGLVMAEVMSVLKESLNASVFAYSLLRTDQFTDDLSYEMFVYTEEETFTKTVKFKPKEKETITGRVFETGEPLILCDGQLADYDTFLYYPAACRNVISIPVKQNGRTVAVIEYLTRIDSNGFKNEDETLIQNALAYCSFFISHISITSDIRKKQLEAKILHDVVEIDIKPCIHDLLNCFTNKYSLPDLKYDGSLWVELDYDDRLYLSYVAHKMLEKYAPSFISYKMNATNYFMCLIQKCSMNKGPFSFKHVIQCLLIFDYILQTYENDFTQDEKSEMVLALLCHEIKMKTYSNYDHDELIPEFYDSDNKIFFNDVQSIIFKLLELSLWMRKKPMKVVLLKIEKIYRLMPRCRNSYYMDEQFALIDLLLKDEFDGRRMLHRDLLKVGTLVVSSLSRSFFPMSKTVAENFTLFYECVKHVDENRDAPIENKSIFNREWLRSMIMYNELFVSCWVSIISYFYPERDLMYKCAREVLMQWIEIFSTKKIWEPTASICERYKTEEEKLLLR